MRKYVQRCVGHQTQNIPETWALFLVPKNIRMELHEKHA